VIGEGGVYVKNSLMLVTALAPKVGYDKREDCAHGACEHSSLREAAVKLDILRARNSMRW